MKKMMFLSKNWYFSVQKALIYYTVNKSHHNSFILLVFSPVANFRYVANFRFLTLSLLSRLKDRSILMMTGQCRHVEIKFHTDVTILGGKLGLFVNHLVYEDCNIL